MRTLPISFVAGVILCQGCALLAGDAKKADPFAKWESKISAFEAADEKDPPKEGGVLFVGSSSIRMWDTAEAFPELHTINRGFGGSTMAEVNHFAGRIVTLYQAGTILVYAGDNDINKGLAPEEVAADFREFVEIVRKGNPEVKVIYIAIKPSLSRWKLWPTMLAANRLISEQCGEDPKLEFADISKVTLGGDGKPRPDIFKADGLHLNAAGYEAWKSVIAPLLDGK